jgi:hypothetical protein
MAISAAEASAFASHFAVYRGIAEPGDRLVYACRYPALISSEIQAVVAGKVQDDPEARQDGRLEKLIELDVIRRGIAQNASRYPAGVGPIEVEAKRVSDGETSLKAALAQVREPDVVVQLAPIYVHALTWHAEQLASSKEGETALLWMRLLAEACLATCPGKSINEKLEIAATGFIQVAGVALGSYPDGEMLHAADALGKDVLTRLPASGADPRRGALLHALGTLYSDPVSGPSGWGTEESVRVQQMRKLEALKGPALARLHQEKYPFPGARDALETALGYYERALNDREGERRGVTLKAMVQTLEFLARASGAPADLNRIRELGAEALTLLPPENYHHRALVASMARLGLETSQAPSASPEFHSPESVLAASAALSPADPAGALKVLLDAKALFEDAGTEMERRKRLIAMTRLIPRAHGGELKAPLTESFNETINRVFQTAQDEQWSLDRFASTLVWLALHSEPSNDEAIGLRLLGMATQQSPTIGGYQEAVAYLYATLCIGTAVNALNGNTPSEAVQAYGQSLAPLLRLGMPSAVFELLGRMADVAIRPGEDMVFAVVGALAPVAFEIDRALGPEGDEALQAVYRNALAHLGEEINSASIAMLLQLAKGSRFSAMLRQGPGFDWRQDDTALRLSAEIARLQDQVEVASDFEPMNDALLVSPSRAHAATEADTAADRLANLQRGLDRHLNRLIIAGVRSSAILDPEFIGQVMGPDTVLLDYYLAAHDNKQSAVYVMAYTAERILLFKNLAGESREYLVGPEGAEVVADTLGIHTLHVRRNIERDPEGGLLHADATQALAIDFHLLLGTPLWNYLEEQRQAGKTHLCIRPYGALRYYPMHLLGPGEEDLARHWTVTYIPSLECLLRPAPDVERESIQALGLSYTNEEPFPLPELPAARSEVHAIAAIGKSAPKLDAEVTEEAVFEALRTNRWVHLCAHGANNAVAPLFQQMFVTPDAASDGRICAFEIFGHDLRGLEQISLGSCDSGLGRFDAGDNLIGMPAALLAAGVSSIVASLWELSDEAAGIFFPVLYAGLAQGSTRLDAFRAAQLAVRKALPEPRDWAAFCYIGGWSYPDPAILEGKGPYITLDR